MSRRRPLLLAGLGVVAFLAFVVALLPASLALRYLPPGVAVEGLDGTVWNGRASQLRIGAGTIGAVEWRCRCMALLTGRLRYAVTLRPAASDVVDALVTATPGGEVAIESLNGALPLVALGAVVPEGWDGRLELDAVGLRLSAGQPGELRGRIRALQLRAPMRPADDLGGYEIQLGEGFAESGVVGGRIRDLGGPLTVRGTLRFEPGRRYLLEGEVAPTPAARPGMLEALTFLAPPDAAGRRQFTIEGSY